MKKIIKIYMYGLFSQPHQCSTILMYTESYWLESPLISLLSYVCDVSCNCYPHHVLITQYSREEAV